MVKMLDLDRHADCPLWEALASKDVPWTGLRYACLNVLQAYCKVFDKQEIYDLIVRKTCQSCKCPRETHAIYQQQTTTVHERLGFKVVSPADSGVEPRDLGYTWVPPGIRVSSRINRYFEQLPLEKVPKIGSEGARYREQQISYQLPKQDLSLDHCKHLEDLHDASYEDFVTARNEIALDIGYVKDAAYDEHCAHCEGEVNVGEMVVAAPKFVESVMWHPRCFTCSTCNELLVDLTYCVHEDKIYCERHYAELLKPRCAGCDELRAENKTRVKEKKRPRRRITHFFDNSNTECSQHTMGELLSEIGDLVFSLVISYIGAIEFLYVVRHLYHWSFNHDAAAENINDEDHLGHLQEKMRQQLKKAKNNEDKAGNNIMQDGVQYKDGFRLDPLLAEIASLTEQLQDQALNALKRQELEKELAKLQKVYDQTRKELEKAEAALRKEEEDNARKIVEAEQKREREQRKLEEEQAAKKQKEAEENARQIAEKEKQREQEQRRKEEEQQKQKEAEENARKLIEAEKQREEEQRRKEEEQAQKEAEENALKLVEMQKQREEEQRRKEEEEEQKQKEAEEMNQKLIEAEKQREEEQRRQEEEEENNRKIQENEKQREQEQRRKELEEEEENAHHMADEDLLEAETQEQEEEENARKYLEIEHKLEEQLRAAEQEAELTEKERQLIESIKRRDIQEEEHNEQKEAELLRRILEARDQLTDDSEDEQSRRLIEREQDQEAKQRRIEENALLFLEAEKEMAEIQQKMQEAVEIRHYGGNLESAPQTPILEEPCIKKLIAPLLDEESKQPINQKVKTQLAQDLNESYTVSSKPLLFPGVSDEGSSLEPFSSMSTQPSEDLTTGTDSQNPTQQERQEPDGEDASTPSLQYTEDYLRSLDGIKQRPIVRDGSGRRRAFKKRRSSNSSNSSRESRTSRDEELKMFTSLEEEEMKTTGDSEFTPIRYTSEPTLKVKGHHRRHKRSPAKDMKSDESLRSSLERLGEETSDPWGETQPEHYKNTDFWKREKAMSIDEEMEFERPASSEEIAYETATNMPSASSFEEATQIQNEQALTALRKQASKEAKNEEIDEKAIFVDESDRSENKTNLQTSQITEREASPARSSASPRLRRSPRIEEMDQYEERGKENHDEKSSPSHTSSLNTPSINVQTPLDFGSWRDEHGLMMEGLSDFYDFQASVNPSRSRNTSRNPSPANTAPSTPLPKDVAFDLEISNSKQPFENTVEVYDDTDDLETNEFKKENIIKFIESLDGREPITEEVEYELSTDLNENSLKHEIKYVMDDLTKRTNDRNNKAALLPMVNIIEDSSLTDLNESAPQDDMNSLVASLRTQRIGRGSHSRSKSPLPTPGNLQRSLENRRDKMIRHNEDILEKLIESNLLPETPPTEEELEMENMNLLVDSLRATQRSSANSPRCRSPLPTAINIERSLENRRNRRIQENDELLERQNSSGSQSPVIFNDSFKEVDKVSSSHEDEIHSLDQSLKVTQQRARSKSPMRLPSAENLGHSIDSRRNKLIERNDEFQKQIDTRNHTPETPNLTVEHVYEFESNSELNETIQNLPNPTISLELDDVDEDTSSKVEKEVDENDECSRENMNLLVHSLRVARSRSRTPVHRRSRSKSPMKISPTDKAEQCEACFTPEAPNLTVEYAEQDTPVTPGENDDTDDCSRENMNLLVQSLRVARSRSRTPIHRRSRSKSPMSIPPTDKAEQDEACFTPETPNMTVEYVYEFETTNETSSQIPTIFLESDDTDDQKVTVDFDDCSREQMDSLVQSLRVARSRSHSKSPMCLPRAKTPEPEFVYEFESPEKQDHHKRSRHSRSHTPSRSYSVTPSGESSPSSNEESESTDFHVMLNLEGSHNRTLSKNSEELESLKLYRQRKLDEEALEQLKNASEEMELRTLSPLDHDELNEQQGKDLLADLPITERVKLLRKSPTTPDYERTISQEMHDVERIRQETLENRFKRSTYVGESLDIGAEYESLRREAAQFQRSHSPSPSYSKTEMETAHLKAEEKRKIQDMILAELTGSSQETSQMLKTGAIPKTGRITSPDSEDIQDNKEESGDNDRFRRSASRSRSPLQDDQRQELVEIEKEAIKREIQDNVLDEISNNSMNFQEFSRHLNPDFFDNDRRASDSALIQKPELLLQLQESNYDSCMDMDPEEYHHYRRFSLAQEQPVEEYPSDDYIVIEQIEVRTRSGSQTWVREDFYSEEVNDFLTRQEEIGRNKDEGKEFDESKEMEQDNDEIEDNMEENLQQVNDEDFIENDEDYSNNSDDDRQTVVEVDDEIDEDISDFKAEESHHEASECEEADREMDRYAGREASDWIDVDNNQEENQGAVGGSIQSPYDSDSFAIDQIYDEAIKNRKQSGILREYDSILMQMSNSEQDEQFALTKKKPKNVEFNVNFLDNGRKDTEMRYLGNAKATERQSVRLRSRYGYNPILQTNHLDDDSEVDLNYIPKREYNWRKNFKLDEDKQTNEDEEFIEQENQKYETEEQLSVNWEESKADEEALRKYSLEGENITLFSRSPERTILEEDYADNADNEEVQQDATTFKDSNIGTEIRQEENVMEKPKKKKTKKKSRKESRESLEFVNKDEEDIPDSYIYSRRSSSIQMETESPKRKSRSRRSSKSSLTNDDSQALFSPRSSVGYAEPIADIMEENTETVPESGRPKKIKKRKKAKEIITESPKEEAQQMFNVQPISAVITPESSNSNILSALSSQNSVCVTPASIDLETSENLEEEEGAEKVITATLSFDISSKVSTSTSPVAATTNLSRTNSITTPVDTFDILKDANFYPLF